MEILQYTFGGEGMTRVFENEKWMVGIKNWKPMNDIANINNLERHNQTDELFILLNGRCTLIYANETAGGLDIQAVEMEPYFVLGPDGQWIEDPEHVTLLFTATTETPSGAVMTTKVGDQEVRIGKTDYILKSEYIEFSGGTIVDVNWEK